MEQAQGSLSGARILVVEDEYYLADDLARALQRAGAEVVGPVGSIAEAEAAVDARGFDCAVLDMNLRGDAALPVAERLEAAGIPFLIATGYDTRALPESLREVPRVEKPFDVRRVVEALPQLIDRR